MITFQPEQIPSINGYLFPTAGQDEENFSPYIPPKTFTMNQIIAFLEVNVKNIIESAVLARIDDQVSARNNVIKQLLLDAWVKSGRGNIGEEVTTIMHELRQVLPANLASVTNIVQLQPAGWAPQAPLDVLQILFEGIVKLSTMQKSKIELNICHFNNLVSDAALSLKTDLIAVSCDQHGGPQDFAIYLDGNDYIVEVYMTPEVDSIMRVARLELDAKVKVESEKLVRVAMNAGDWRIWPRSV